MTRWWSFWVLGGLGCDTPDTRACTEMGCTDGLFVDLEPDLKGEATYTFDFVLDGEAVQCVSTIPFGTGTDGCTPSGSVMLVASGTMGSVEDQSIPEFEILTTPASVQLKVWRSALLEPELLVDTTLTPTYETVQPNGPDCEPVCSQDSAVVDTTP